MFKTKAKLYKRSTKFIGQLIVLVQNYIRAVYGKFVFSENGE